MVQAQSPSWWTIIRWKEEVCEITTAPAEKTEPSNSTDSLVNQNKSSGPKSIPFCWDLTSRFISIPVIFGDKGSLTLSDTQPRHRYSPSYSRPHRQGLTASGQCHSHSGGTPKQSGCRSSWLCMNDLTGWAPPLSSYWSEMDNTKGRVEGFTAAQRTQEGAVPTSAHLPRQRPAACIPASYPSPSCLLPICHLSTALRLCLLALKTQ